VHRLANPAYLSRFLFSGLLRVAPYCVPGGIRVVSILPSYMASTKGFVRCEGMNARRRVPSASPSCLPLPSSRRAGFRPLPLPGLGHIERHANEAVGSRAAVTQNACAGEDPTYAAPVGAGGIPARTSRSPPWPGAVCGRSTHGRRGGWSRIGSRGWVAPRSAARGGGCSLRQVVDQDQHVGDHRRLVHVERTAAFDNSVHLLLRARITFLSAEGSVLAKSLVHVHSPKRREFGVLEALAPHLESGSRGT
jgi:hypothetical protein